MPDRLAMNAKHLPPCLLQDLCEPQHALRRDHVVLAASGEGHGHGEGIGPELGAALPVFIGHLGLRAAKRHIPGLLELLILNEVRHAIETAHARHQLRMQGGEGQHRRTAHRTTSDEDPARLVTLLHVGNDLHHVRLRLRPHPRSLGPVVWRYDDHAMPGGNITHSTAFATGVLDELPAIRSVTMKRQHHVMRGLVVKGRRQKLHIVLLRAIRPGGESNVLRICCADRGSESDEDGCEQKRKSVFHEMRRDQPVYQFH